MDKASDLIIEEAILEVKSGNRKNARILLKKAVRINPNCSRAWYLLSQLVDQKDQSIYCLEKVISLEPSNTKARNRLDNLLHPKTVLNSNEIEKSKFIRNSK